MKKTTNKINIEETETPNWNTPNWDDFDEKYFKRHHRIVVLINILLMGLSSTFYIIDSLLRCSYLRIIILGIIIMIVLIFIFTSEYLIFIKFFNVDSRIYMHFLRKNSLAYKEYVEDLEQEQYGEVS